MWADLRRIILAILDTILFRNKTFLDFSTTFQIPIFVFRFHILDIHFFSAT